MNRNQEFEKERHDAWDKSKNVQERINELEKLVSKYPEDMILLSDIAVSYLEMGDINNAVKTYQEIIDRKDTFELIWDNQLGNAYLFTKDYSKAIETLKNSKVIDYDQGLFLALSYLKTGDREEAKKQFEKWISEDLEKSFDRYRYNKYLEALLNNDEKSFIENIWNKYYEKYSDMEPYQLYCKLYKQHYLTYLTPESDEDYFEDDDFEIPRKLNKIQFEQLSNEYLYLERKTIFGDMKDSDYDRYFKLRDLLFADIIF